jgi:antirestriction protein ArdC
MPQNASTARQYSGVNILILWKSVIEHGFTGQSWLTFRQALSMGGYVRKGERGTIVVFAEMVPPASSPTTRTSAPLKLATKRTPFRS